MASEGEEPITNKKANDGNDIKKYIQEEMSKILQKISSTSLATSGEHYAFTTYSNITPDINTWILDSGMTDHMSPQKSMFKTYEPVNTNHKVFTTNGGVGKGTIDFNKVILKDVLYVTDLKANLLSLTQVVIDTAWRFILDSESCFLCIKATGKKISSVRRIGGLLLDGLEEDAWQQAAYSTQSEQSVILLHRRFGHPSFHLLKTTHPTMFKGLNIESLTCEACQFVTHERTPFPQTNHRLQSTFECIHSDVWGPYSVLGLSHHRWFILFVDDFSRYTWVYLLKTKTEIPPIITYSVK